jgi:hypothetical protein
MQGRALHDYIVERVDPTEFFKSIFPDYVSGKNVQCPFHKEGQEENPSLSLSKEGKGYCFACEFKCTSIVWFYKDYHKLANLGEACLEIFKSWIRPVIPDKTVERLQEALRENEEVREFLANQRGIGTRIRNKFRLGYDKETNRIAIPVPNEFGYWINIRLYDWTGTQPAKVISWKKGYGSTVLFPAWVLEEPTIYLFEGEMDCLLAHQLRLPAATATGGAGTWKKEFTQSLARKNVILCRHSMLRYRRCRERGRGEGRQGAQAQGEASQERRPARHGQEQGLH